MTTKSCAQCNKDINLKKECEEEGTAYHSECFRCSVCDRFLTESDVNIRDGKLFCKNHASLVAGTQPFCKVYFNNLAMCYRVIYAAEEGE